MMESVESRQQAAYEAWCNRRWPPPLRYGAGRPPERIWLRRLWLAACEGYRAGCEQGNVAIAPDKWGWGPRLLRRLRQEPPLHRSMFQLQWMFDAYEHAFRVGYRQACEDIHIS